MLLSFFLRIDLYLLISEVIAQVFNPTAELAITAGPPTNQANAEIETHPLTAEKKTNKMQKEPSRGVFKKRYSKNMQQIYRRTPMLKCDFNKVAKQLY